MREEVAPRAEVTGGGGEPTNGGQRLSVGEEDQRMTGGGRRWGTRRPKETQREMWDRIQRRRLYAALLCGYAGNRAEKKEEGISR